MYDDIDDMAFGDEMAFEDEMANQEQMDSLAEDAMAMLDADMYAAEDYSCDFDMNAPMYIQPKRMSGILGERIRVKYIGLLRDRPDRNKAFLVEVKRGVECWAPYSECNLFTDTNEFDVPKWLHIRMKEAGEI